MVQFLLPILLFFIFSVPLTLTGTPLLFLQSPILKICFLLFSPFIFILTYVLTSGLLSKPFQPAIVAGKFPRDLKHFVYGPRRLYGLCWTSVYYFTPLYYVLLTVPFLKKLMFRLFGYKGNTDFTIYPDTWVRDWPLLKIGKCAYLSNRCTIGTNICLKGGNILVDEVEIGENGMIGHLAMLAPGAKLAENSEIGVGVAFGIRSKIGEASKVCPGCVINHGVEIGNNSEIGTMSFVGIRAVIKDNIKLPGGSNIPSGAIINSKEDAQQYLSSETKILNVQREKLINNLKLSQQSEVLVSNTP